jgi:hypothetical protein
MLFLFSNEQSTIQPNQNDPDQFFSEMSNIQALKAAAINYHSSLSPFLKKRIGIALLLFLISPRLFVLLLLPALAFCIGFYASEKTENLAMYQRIAMLKAKGEFKKDRVVKTERQKAAMRSIPLVDRELSRLLDHVVEDFVSKWYDTKANAKSGTIT